MISLEQYRQAIGRADLDLTARGGIVARKVCGEFFGGMASLHAAQRTYVYDN